MMKEKYIQPELDIMLLEVIDVIRTSETVLPPDEDLF